MSWLWQNVKISNHYLTRARLEPEGAQSQILERWSSVTVAAAAVVFVRNSRTFRA